VELHEGAEEILAPADHHLSDAVGRIDILYLRLRRSSFYLYALLVNSRGDRGRDRCSQFLFRVFVVSAVNWKYKALLQGCFSTIPLGEPLNYFFQKHVTKTLPMPDAKFANMVSVARTHLDFLRQYWPRPLSQATFYEFGAGWDMAVPLTFYALGVDRQILVDIRRLLRIELVNDTVAKYQRLTFDEEIARKPGFYVNGGQRDPSAVLREQYGIEYKAPCDARQTGLPTASIDCITSTDTLEHIPPPSLRAILKECHRLLRDDGVMSFQIDYQDHYSYFDKNISVYNFLQYSDRAWRLFSPPLQYQNRLRHRDYLSLLDQAGFEILEERRQDGSKSDCRIIERLPVNQRFKNYSGSELAVRKALLVARKRRDAQQIPRRQEDAKKL
jgi:SAM-dependent methyltransferase